MIQRLFAALNVDYIQWKAITKTALIVDLRASAFVRGRFGQKTKSWAAFLGQFVFYTFAGGFISLFVLFCADLFLSAELVLSYVMFMVGTAALLDHNAAITSPDDYPILAFRPVTSRTYFAARITNALVYTSAMTTLFAYLPVAAFFIRWGASVGFAAIAAIYGASIFMAFAMVAVYAWLTQIAGANRIKRALSYLQFVFSFLVYGGYFLASRVFTRNMLASISLPKTIGLLMIPPSWFASYLDLAAGRHSLLEIVPAAASIAALIALTALISGRLSLEYADRLGAIASATAAPALQGPARTRKRWLFRNGEGRAIALLIRSQFANDMKFRMSVLAILPLTIVYLAMGISRTGTIADPFAGRSASQGLALVTVAMMMFPAMLRMSLTRSDAFRAAWIFFASPSDRTRLVRAAKNVLVVTFILPYLATIAVATGYFADNLPHLLVHLVVMGLLSHLVLQLITIFEPVLPFSRPLVKGRSSTRIFVLVLSVGLGSLFFPLLAPVIYRGVASVVVAIVGLVAASVLLDWLTRLRIEAQTAKLEFEG